MSFNPWLFKVPILFHFFFGFKDGTTGNVLLSWHTLCLGTLALDLHERLVFHFLCWPEKLKSLKLCVETEGADVDRRSRLCDFS